MRDDRPRPLAIELGQRWLELDPAVLEAVERPDGQVGHQQEGDQLPAGFLLELGGRVAAAPRRVQQHQRLAGALHHGGHGQNHADHRH